MKKGMILLGAMISVFFLNSCTSGHACCNTQEKPLKHILIPEDIVIPQTFPGSDKMFQVNNSGTVEVIGIDTQSHPMHWLFVNCEHWSGCYIRCQGPQKICKSIATKSDLKVSHIISRY